MNPSQDKDLSLTAIVLYTLHAISKRVWSFVGIFLFFTAAFIAIALVLPKKYTSEAIVHIPKSASTSGLKSLLGDMEGVASLLGVEAGGESQLIFTLIETREFSNHIIQKFHLDSVYKMKANYFEADLLKEFRSNFAINDPEDGILTLTFKSKDPVFSKNVVNYIVQYLDSLYLNTRKEENRHMMSYLEERLNTIDDSLQVASAALAAHQNKFGIFEPEVQIEKTIEALATLENEKISTQMRLELEKNRQGAGSPVVTQLKQVLRSYQKKINHITNNHNPSSVMIHLKGSQNELLKYKNLYRELRIQELIYKTLRTTYEEVKIEVLKNIPTMIVLQEAWVNHKKISPPRTPIAAAGMMLGFFFALGFSLISELIEEERSENSKYYQMWNSIKNNLLKALGRK